MFDKILGIARSSKYPRLVCRDLVLTYASLVDVNALYYCFMLHEHIQLCASNVLVAALVIGLIH